jgi:hypothetical protein
MRVCGSNVLAQSNVANWGRICTHTEANLVMALHSLGSVPLRLLSLKDLQVGATACTSNVAVHAWQDKP